MGYLALAAFWVLVIKLWIPDGPKIPLIFIALWILGLFGFPILGWDSGYQFMSFQAILAVIVIVIDRCKNAA